MTRSLCQQFACLTEGGIICERSASSLPYTHPVTPRLQPISLGIQTPTVLPCAGPTRRRIHGAACATRARPRKRHLKPTEMSWYASRLHHRLHFLIRMWIPNRASRVDIEASFRLSRKRSATIRSINRGSITHILCQCGSSTAAVCASTSDSWLRAKAEMQHQSSSIADAHAP